MAENEIDKATWLEFVNTIHGTTALGIMGGRVLDVDDDHIEIELPIADAARQPFGLLHGGVSLLLAETAASTHATWGVDLTEVQPVGIEISGSHLHAVREGTVRAVGRVLSRTRRFIVHEVDILHVESGKLLAKTRVTNYYRKVNPGEDQ